MRKVILATILIGNLAYANFERFKDEKIFKDEPIEKGFVDGEWICTAEELNEASKSFMKCENTPVFRDCYAKMIKKTCNRKLL